MLKRKSFYTRTRRRIRQRLRQWHASRIQSSIAPTPDLCLSNRRIQEHLVVRAICSLSPRLHLAGTFGGLDLDFPGVARAGVLATGAVDRCGGGELRRGASWLGGWLDCRVLECWNWRSLALGVDTFEAVVFVCWLYYLCAFERGSMNARFGLLQEGGGDLAV